MFFLVEECGISYTEAYEMPIFVRKWWLKRKEKQNKKDPPGLFGKKK